MWVDSFDRAPPLEAREAIAACRSIGGHLATERDLIEAIRAGLPNGSGGNILTSDLELGSQGGGLLVGVVKWTGTDTAFTDAHPTYSTWGLSLIHI